jgi:hypothetical protein
MLRNYGKLMPTKPLHGAENLPSFGSSECTILAVVYTYAERTCPKYSARSGFLSTIQIPGLTQMASLVWALLPQFSMHGTTAKISVTMMTQYFCSKTVHLVDAGTLFVLEARGGRPCDFLIWQRHVLPQDSCLRLLLCSERTAPRVLLGVVLKSQDT